MYALLCSSRGPYSSWAAGSAEIPEQVANSRFPFKFGLGHPQTLTLAVGWQPEEPVLHLFGFLWARPPPAVLTGARARAVERANDSGGSLKTARPGEA